MFPMFIERIRRDIPYRIKVILCCSFIFNFGYAIFLFVVGKITSSKWFFVMSTYYVLLSLTRIFVFWQLISHKKLVSKIKTMRVCGAFLLLINLVVSTLMFLLIHENQIVQHHEITVITMATYTFTALTVAIYNSVKYLRKNDHLHFCVKIISLISASVSLVMLTNTMLATFGADNTLLRSIVLPLLSGAVAIFIILSAILLLRKANLELRILNHEKE